MNPIAHVVIVCSFIVLSSNAWSTEMPEEIAQQYVELFRNDNVQTPSTDGLVVNYEINEKALAVFRRALVEEDSTVRDNIVSFLERLDERTSVTRPLILVNEAVISMLAHEGMSKNDSSRMRASDLLLEQCTSETLARYSDHFIQLLKESPSADLFLLIAKAKPPQARPVVEELMKAEPWKNNASARFAAAALGNTEIEDEYIKRAMSAQDGPALERAIMRLRRIGTRRSLQTIASFLRSPLVVGPLKISLRLRAISALRYNFPDNTILSNRISTQEDYARVEQFVAETLDVHFDGPLPPFYTRTPLPNPMPGPR